MAYVGINTGSAADAGDGSTLRAGANIINANFQEIYNYFGDGSTLTYEDDWVSVTSGIVTTSSIGIGTTNISIGADSNNTTVLNAGIITANYYYGDGSGLTNVSASAAAGYFSSNDTGINTTTSVGIGTTTATGAADVNNTLVLNVGIVTANSLYGNLIAGVSTLGFTTFSSDAWVSGALTVGGNLKVTGDITYDEVTGVNINISGIATVGSAVTMSVAGIHVQSGIVTADQFEANTSATLASVKVSDLTNNRVVISGASGELEDDGNFTFDGTDLQVGSAISMYVSSGIVSATSFYGDGSNLEGISTNDGKFVSNSTGIHTTTNVGIGTTTATGAADTNNTTVVNAGIITANTLYSRVVVAQTFSGTGTNSGLITSRTKLSGTTGTVSSGSSETLNIAGYKAYSLLKVGISSAAWVTLYTDNDSRVNDLGRTSSTDPTPGAGVIAEVNTTNAGISTFLMSPGVIGWNDDLGVGSTIYARVTNNESSSSAITLDLTVLQMEV